MRREFLLLAIPVLLLAGCRARPAAQQPPQPPPIQILAYINVSSGCQQATVDFLQALQAKYPRLAVELVDFGDGGAGSERWQMSGHRCMTIEINGRNVVKYPHEGTLRVVDFRMPPGVLWSHEDLAEAVAAAVAGTLQPATEDETEADPAQTQQKLQQLKAKASQRRKPAPPAKSEAKEQTQAPTATPSQPHKSAPASAAEKKAEVKTKR